MNSLHNRNGFGGSLLTADQRAAKESEWDPRTPLERLESLTKQEQTAFLALGAIGGSKILQGGWRGDTGEITPNFFGKAECEWPSFNLWRFKLPALRLTTYSETDRKCALGMSVGSVVWNCHIAYTADGERARDAYWDKLH